MARFQNKTFPSNEIIFSSFVAWSVTVLKTQWAAVSTVSELSRDPPQRNLNVEQYEYACISSLKTINALIERHLPLDNLIFDLCMSFRSVTHGQ